MKVSVIIPCYNEQESITDLLSAIYSQTYPREEIEVIISDGMSTDATRERITNFKADFPDLEIRVIDNIKQTIPSGLNLAVRDARGDYILRLDAHSNPFPDYFTHSIVALEEGLGDNIGGVISIQAADNSWIAQSIAIAAGHPLGVGDARYRIGSGAREVDTVAFGAFRSSLFDEIGFYDETLLANEDYELNVRIRKAGGKVWLDPEIRANYFARPTLRSLAIQYWRYGFWKLRMLLRYPDTFRWRQISGLFVLSWLVLGILSIWFPAARWLLAAEAVLYGSALIISGVSAAWAKKKVLVGLGLPLAIATMHFSWGSGFLWSLLVYSFDKIINK
ncbi:MAG: glycosyltransferase family 2 protein [Anaerolineales bacterium]|nr:glycosyltransferase family 2 protein [Anaerolineales bacterium]